MHCRLGITEPQSFHKIRLALDTACPPEWKLTNRDSGTCVRASKFPQSWYNASDMCHGLGGDLLKILDDTTYNFVLNDLMLSQDDILWIGLKFDNTKKIFKWNNEMEEIPFSSWDLHYIRPSEKDECVPIYKKLQRTLSQLLCSDKLEFFCEIPPVCVNNSFGVGCTEHCSPYCAGANKTCDVKSGSCDFGCVDGYYGTMCDRAKTDSPQTSFFYSKAAIIYIVVFVSAGISACVILAPV
ncbi:hypothetical protein RRG08_058831 [Elysia crispata]|uniref:C-type lectin domain-containing protein n=1 Tax=Elysia crispata TaxID=231223 RepID=A0AAE1CQ60_9GAST|nr:hypothetical protein RRG08_058831 [Elysia crispata]